MLRKIAILYLCVVCVCAFCICVCAAEVETVYSTYNGSHTLTLQADGTYLYDDAYTMTDHGTYLKGSVGTNKKSLTLYRLNDSTYVSASAVSYTHGGVTQYLYDYTAFFADTPAEPTENGMFEIWRAGERIAAYDSLQSAVNACTDGDTVVITGSFSVTEGVYISKDITIDGSECTADRSGWTYAWLVTENGAEVTLKNLTLDGGAEGFQVDYASVTYTNYTIPLYTGSAANDPKASMSAVVSAGELTCEGVTVQNCYTSANGGALHIVSGIAKLTGCAFIHNQSDKYGGAVYIGSNFQDRTVYPVDTVDMENCAFSGNYCGHGGAIYAFNTEKLTVSGSDFLNNTANKGKGGAIDLATENTTEPAAQALGLPFMVTYIDSCTFDGNWAGNDGFAIQTYDSDLYITDSDFLHNVGVHPTSSVGTVSIEAYRDPSQRIFTRMEGCLFSGNIGPVSCYGDHSSASDLEVSDCIFRENSGNESILLYSAVSCFTDCQFIGEQVVFGVFDARIYENYEIPPHLTLNNVTVTDTLGPADILIRKQNHNEQLNTYQVTLQGTTQANVTVWDANSLAVEGTHTGNIQLDGATPAEKIVLADTAQLQGDILTNPDTCTVILRYPYGETETALYWYLEPGKTYTRQELSVPQDAAGCLGLYTDSACTSLWDMTAGELTLYGAWQALPNIDQWQLVLEDDLLVNFYLQISENILDVVSVQITLEDRVCTYEASRLSRSEDGKYTAQIHVAAAQMTRPITVQLSCDGTPCQTASYTVRQYCDTVLADESLSQYHTLIEKMLTYGAMAQTYFDYYTDALANDGITDTARTPIPETAGQAMSVSGKAEDIRFYGASLVFRDKITVRFYFRTTQDITGCTFAADAACTPIRKDGYYYVEMGDILPQALDQQLTLTVTDSSGSTLTVCYSPMDYILRMHQKGSSSLKALMQALYDYHLAAKQLRT